MKTILLLLICITCTSAYCQLTINQNTYCKISGNTNLRLNNIDFATDAELICEANSTISLSTSASNTITLYGEKSPHFHNLIVSGNTNVEYDNDSMNVYGNISFTDIGIMDLKYCNLYLQGTLLGENEKSYLTSSKEGYGYLVYETTLTGKNSLGGIGLELTSTDNNKKIRVVRKHYPATYSNKSSMKRVFEITPTNLSKISVGYHNAINNNIIEPVVCANYENPTTLTWSVLPTLSWQNSQINAQNTLDYPIKEITVFEYPSLDFPLFVSATRPFFEITGNEKHPNSKLIIFNRSGEIIYQKTPYRNDFDGSTLNADTYYYIYYPDNNSTKPIKKSSFEKI